MSSTIAGTPAPPYYAVIFTSTRAGHGEGEGEEDGYGEMAERMMTLAAQQPGYLGVESVRAPGGLGITVSYWESRRAIAEWKANAEHRVAQEKGQRVWYEDYRLRIAKVEVDYGKSGK
jgi:heme-degrading monooxygenase HmoA